MNKIVKIILLLSILTCTLSGCGTCLDGPYAAFAIIGGNHANSASYDIPEIVITETSKDNKYSPEFFLSDNYRINKISGIVPDSTPTVFEEDYINDTVFSKRWDTLQEDLGDFIANMYNKKADDEEIDMLKALFVARNELTSVSEDTEKRILIYNSGLSTSGALNFANNKKYNDIINKNEAISDNDVQQILDELHKQKEIPDLTGIRIRWYGIGLVSGKQAELTPMVQDNLKTIWQEILKSAGASEVDFIDINKIKDNKDTKDLPKVSVVEFDNIIPDDDSKRLSAEKLGFEPQTAQFKKGTEKERREILSFFVKSGTGSKLLLVGTTSAGENGGDGIKLSFDRAKAVKDELISLGMAENNISTIGVGTQHHRYNSDEFVNGSYDGKSTAAQENRSVYILDDLSEEATKFKSDYDKIAK